MKKIIFTFFFVVLLFLPLEIASRVYWRIKNDLSFFAPEPMYIFYPLLKIVHETKITADDGYYDILFLGGSVLYDAGQWTKATSLLQEKLKNITNLPIRIHNVARPSHSSRDSLFKYRFLSDKHFDQVIVYDSINEVRANNCPPKMFQLDYSHYSWYHKINFFEHYPYFKFLTLPYTIFSLLTDIQEKKGLIHFVPTDIPNEEWVKYGNVIKSATAFENNINEILTLAKKRKEPLLLTSFAFYVPKDYTYLKFRTKKLDYDKHTFYIEIWGKPINVILGILTHNNVLRKLAAQNPNVMFLDEFSKMPKGKKFYNDICHLTDTGLETLLNDFADTILSKN